MTQRCRYDEQVLDYVYGELSAAERAEFERHLSTCASCPPQVHSFSRVHSEVRGLPRLEPSPEAMQRMTALLMQEAAQVKPGAGKNGVSSADPSAAPGGKVIELRPRGLRRILTHPATGVTAVAAAALLFVMFRPPGPDTEVPAPAPAAHPTMTAKATATTSPAGSTDNKAAAGKAAPAPETVAAAPASPADPAVRPAAPPARAALAKEQDGRAIEGEYAAADPAKQQPAEPPGETDGAFGKLGPRPVAKGKKKGDSLDGLLVAEAERAAVQKPREFAVPPGAPAPAATAPASPIAPTTGARTGEADKKEAKPLVALADKRELREEAPAAEPSFAQPPPPPPSPVTATQAKAPRTDSSSIGSELAARSRQRTVDELENQALAQAPSATSLDSSQRGRYAAGAGAAGTGSSAPAQGGTLYANKDRDKADEASGAARSAAPVAADDDSDAPAPGRNNVGRRDTTLADEAPRQLHAVQELLTKGRCAEALAVLNRIEQGTPTLRGLADARAQYQVRCAAANQQQLTPFTPSPQLPAPAAAPAGTAPSRSPLEAQVPSPKPAYRMDRSAASSAPEMRAKKASKPVAPAKAKAAAY